MSPRGDLDSPRPQARGQRGPIQLPIRARAPRRHSALAHPCRWLSGSCAFLRQNLRPPNSAAAPPCLVLLPRVQLQSFTPFPVLLLRCQALRNDREARENLHVCERRVKEESLWTRIHALHEPFRTLATAVFLGGSGAAALDRGRAGSRWARRGSSGVKCTVAAGARGGAPRLGASDSTLPQHKTRVCAAAI